MKIFISYARADQAAAGRVVERLRQIDHDPWVDQQLSGGQQWWDEILRVIREIDVFVMILSPASLGSEACRLERHYAQHLGKYVLPVKVAPISVSALPPELSSVQHVDFIAGDPNDEVAALIRALNRRPPPRPLPNPLPAPPPTPLSYLSDIHERINLQPQLSYDDQRSIVHQLEQALRSGDLDEKQGGVALLSSLSQRRDLFADTAREIERLNVEQLSFAMSHAPPGGFHSQAPHQWMTGHGGPVPTGPVPGPPQPAGTSKTVKVFAWIGAIFVALVILSLILGQSGYYY